MCAARAESATRFGHSSVSMMRPAAGLPVREERAHGERRVVRQPRLHDALAEQ